MPSSPVEGRTEIGVWTRSIMNMMSFIASSFHDFHHAAARGLEHGLKR